MGIHSPPQRNWWKEPVARTEIIWVVIAFLWGLIMFSAMIYWHAVGEQNLSNESYRITPEMFSAKTNAMWQWWPIIEFEKDQTYRLHLSSMDWQHGFSLQPVNINLQVHPNYEMVVTLTPNEAGEFGVVCNEFCGIGHHNMIGKIYVTGN
jgi:cytochrome c oxidase subunit 2